MSDSPHNTGNPEETGQQVSMTQAQRKMIHRLLRELAEHDGDYHWRPDKESVNQARLALKNSLIVPIDTPIPGLLKEIRHHGDDYHHRSDPAALKRALSAIGARPDEFSYEALLEARRSRRNPFEELTPESRPWTPGIERRRNLSAENPPPQPERQGDDGFRSAPSPTGSHGRALLMLGLLVAFLAGAPYLNLPGLISLLGIWILLGLAAEAIRPSR